MFDLYPTTSESEMKSNFVVTYGKEVPFGYPGAGFYLNLCSRHPSACCLDFTGLIPSENTVGDTRVKVIHSPQHIHLFFFKYCYYFR